MIANRHQSTHYDNFARECLPPRSQWPELTPCSYPTQLNCAHALLSNATLYPFKTAFIGSDSTVGYAELQAMVNQISHVLRDQMGLIPGNRVLLRGPNSPMLAACILAVWQVGCVAVPSMPMLRASELAVMIEHAQINAALCSVQLKDELLSASCLEKIVYYGNDSATGLEFLMTQQSTEFIPYATRSDDICLISFTSGTTGKPKATAHFHRDVMAICDGFPVSILGAQADDIFIGTPPLAFTFGLGGLMVFPLRFGATSVLLEKYSPETFLETIQRFNATICFTVPTFYRQLMERVHQFDLPSLRQSVSAGEPLSIATRNAWQRATGLRMIDGIGTTEMLHIFISAANDEIRVGALGKAIRGYQACVLDESDQPVEAGVVGRLAVKGPTGCRYLADDRQQDYVRDGWNVTGDAVVMDSEGYFWYHGRTDDLIISAGYTIAASEVEDILLQHEAVSECAVVGCEDDKRGQVVKAFIVLRDDFIGDENMVTQLQNYVKKMIAPYKYPRVIEFKKSLPRTDSGKLQRFRLRS